MANIGLKIRNSNEQQVVDIMTRCHDWLANELDITSKIEFGRTCHWGKDAFHAGLWYNHSKQSVLNFRNLYGSNMYTMLKIVAHEARHAVQYETGLLNEQRRDNKMTHNGRWESGIWEGKAWSGAYKDAPWEIDARAHEECYAQLVIDAGIISQEELLLTLGHRPGEDKQIIMLANETIRELGKKYGKVSLYQAAVQSQEEDIANNEKFKAIVSKYYNRKNGQWYAKEDNELSYKEVSKIVDKAKKDTKTKYRKDAIAFLTQREEALLKKVKASKNVMFWAAQKNVVEYKSRLVTHDDLVF
jgi:hypothetical protein